MTISILLAQQIAQLFLMIFMGYAVVKLGLLTDEDSKVLSTLVLYLIVPSVILNAFQVDYTQEKVNGLKLAGIASLLLLIILLLIVNLIGKLLNLNEVEIMSIYYSNSGNLKNGYSMPVYLWDFKPFFSGHIAKMYSATRKDSIQKKFFPTLILLP